MNVLLLENIHPIAVQRFRENGFTVETVGRSLGEEDLIAALKDVQLLGIRSATRVSKTILEAADSLVAVGTFSVGYKQVDVHAAGRHGVVVYNAPYSNTRSVAELVIAETIILLRRVMDKSRLMHSGEWDKSAQGAYEVRGKAMGIIGYGSIGSQVSMLAEAMGMNVFFYDIADRLAIGNATKMYSMEEVLCKCDVVSVHVDDNPDNANLIGEREVSLMKKGVILLNLSRGHVVDIDAVHEAVERGIIGGLGLDVFPEEPRKRGEPFVSPLQNLPNTILTPHVGGSTEEAQHDIGETVTGKLITYVETGSTIGSVNFPNIIVAKPATVQRIMHVHHNLPGALSFINQTFASFGVNISAQVLRTNDDVGYVVTDVEVPVPEELVHQLRSSEYSIRLRVI